MDNSYSALIASILSDGLAITEQLIPNTGYAEKPDVWLVLCAIAPQYYGSNGEQRSDWRGGNGTYAHGDSMIALAIFKRIEIPVTGSWMTGHIFTCVRF
ncbi:unnamed protein product [Protopolystoma xenopodis]|uniref:Uncharacterized protein n=1 Tax=Protopolystoma xenopodis TaxID=117903 RepID=A0A3S5AMG8_9PLAT|nr:unnamed protein product [Protopolystoma xenopodis]